jgi:ubiquinone/menaquinone biosynthesis C-methylase UbiE
VVLPNFVVHDLNTARDREQMICEAMRILRPGGHLALVDFMFTDHCVEILRRQGISDARRTRIAGFSPWLGAALMPSTFRMYLVTGSKNASAQDTSVIPMRFEATTTHGT